MSPTATTLAAAATSTAATGTLKFGKNLKVVGILLAVASGVLIGISFPLKKKGLLRSQAGGEAGEGVAYLKSFLWWTGMILMILGEICNFAAYAFVEAIVVTPLGALSVVISAILSSLFLNEKLTFFGWLGCGLCILGSVIIALNGPHESAVGQIREFQQLFLAPGFLAWGSVLIVGSLVIIFYFAPRYGKKTMLWYISVCSMIGGLSVSVTTGLGAAIVTSAMGDNQFKYWFTYFLLAFVAITLITEIYYLNIALAMYNTAMVTPTYYVIFTFFTMVTTIILFKGLRAPASQIITIVMGFLVICLGITILQMSKIDPKNFNKLDRRSTLLLQAARADKADDDDDEKAGMAKMEDPGMDTLRGSFGTVGSIIRARTIAKRMSQSSRRDSHRHTGTISGAWDPSSAEPHTDRFSGMKRHQLYDAPVPRPGGGDTDSIHSLTAKRPTIKFDNRDLVHSYNRPGTGDNTARHEHRQAVGSPAVNRDSGYPPLPPVPHDTSLDNIAGLGANGGKDSSGAIGSTTAVGSVGSQSELLDYDKDKDSYSQLLSYPPLLSKEHAVHSAPATVYDRFRPVPPGRKDSRDLFESPTALRETLLSFPSVTDSARSQDWDEAELEGLRLAEQERVAKEKKSSSSLGAVLAPASRDRSKERRSKKYPKGADPESDMEESESLWRRSLENESAEMPGIRLVPSRK
ncbi:hypothetical protein D9611_010890 [Ephemerocybe angulata]|uniref:DUF803-domain-containing protein n=1 Tax=Ephemerocybe angulata TaxID=980116 RepID=A0A8H5C576_9AGAR|nr:hypothetical protein D9611_010890 [Tulosesus angulatus]